MKKLETVQNEDVNEEAYTHVRNKEKEKEQKKKKKKAKLEINDDEKEFEKAREEDKRSNDGEEVGELREVSKETNTIGEEDMNLRMNGNKDSDLAIRRVKTKKHRVKKLGTVQNEDVNEEAYTHVSEQNDDKRVARTKKGVGNIYENSTPGGTSKRVRFSDHLEEVFTLSDGPIDAKNDDNDGLVRGKRFSQEEDELVKKAVLDYIAVHGLGDEGLNMVLHCKSHSELKNCWKEIGAALPWRPSESIYHRAHVLFERGENRKWTPEEYELIRSYHEKNGSKWRQLADKLGKHRFHVKDTWRRIKLPNMKKGRWEQEEYQTLFDLVNMDLRMKALEEKKKKNFKQGMLRDDLSWEAISNKLGTRSSVLCCMKWYDQLTSPMVREGIWANTDDYHLIDSLYNLDACCIQDVDWDNLLEHRSGDVCRERWDQMVRHIGEHASKSFAEQVEILSQRYCTDVLEAREKCDSKPV
ncbi:hypothetical protein FH972_013261 [Carpinus fangiana]|uniref:Myb-like domain-containing protein n=1 Tax=Carpinus fangiana TaxID=176857 RepID=A0A5N6R686_9ROSI|nr:hypothetical protein FH972_013261 [Carpinus fangiana]